MLLGGMAVGVGEGVLVGGAGVAVGAAGRSVGGAPPAGWQAARMASATTMIPVRLLSCHIVLPVIKVDSSLDDTGKLVRSPWNMDFDTRVLRPPSRLCQILHGDTK